MRIYQMLMAMCLPKFDHQGTNNLIQIVLRATQTLNVLLFVCLFVCCCFFFQKGFRLMSGLKFTLSDETLLLLDNLSKLKNIYIFRSEQCLICCSVLKKTCILVPEITARCNKCFSNKLVQSESFKAITNPIWFMKNMITMFYFKLMFS